jgi:hypothetical protein
VRRFKKDVFIIFSFALLSLYATFPLIFRFRSSFYGYPKDPLAWLWNFWWLRYSWIKGISSDFVSILAYPFGIENYPLYPIWNFFNKYLSILTGEVIAYNLQIILSFFLPAVAMYYLVYHFTKSRPASFFSGLIFSLCPYHFARSWDHLCLSNMHWMIFYLLTLFILDERRTYKSAIICGLCFALVGQFSNFYYVYFMLIFTIVFFLFRAGYRRLKRVEVALGDRYKMVKLIGVGLIIAAMIILPQIGRFAKVIILNPQKAQQKGYIRPFRQLFADSARPLNYFLPAQEHPILGRITEPLNGAMFYGEGGEHSLYLGYVPLILAFIAYKRWRKRKRESQSNPREDFLMSFFIFALFVFMIFSFGPYWGKTGNLFIPFPSYFLYKIFPMFRNYARFGVLVMVSLCVLAGFGLRDMLQEAVKPKKRAVIFCLVTGFVLFEFLNIPPYKITDISKVPEVYQWLKQQPGDFAVAEYPLDGDIRKYQFYQRIHQKSLINGAIPGTPAYDVQKKIIRLSDSNTPRVLSDLGARYAIVHLDTYPYSEGAEIWGELPDFSQTPGLELTERFDNVAVYRVTAQPPQNGRLNRNPDKFLRQIKAEEDISIVSKIKFKQGERLIFKIKYMWIIPIGLLELRVKEITSYEGQKVYRLVAEAKTSKLFSFFFKAETKFESYMDVQNLCSRGYEECIQIRGQPPKEKRVVYDWEEQIMQFRGVKKRISSCPQDPISAMYYIRAQELGIGKKFNFNIEVSKRDSRIEAEVIKKQNIKTIDGQISAWVVKAVLKTGKDLRPQATITFWLTDDENKIPLLIKAKTSGGFISLTSSGEDPI